MVPNEINFFLVSPNLKDPKKKKGGGNTDRLRNWNLSMQLCHMGEHHRFEIWIVPQKAAVMMYDACWSHAIAWVMGVPMSNNGISHLSCHISPRSMQIAGGGKSQWVKLDSAKGCICGDDTEPPSRRERYYPVVVYHRRWSKRSWFRHHGRCTCESWTCIGLNLPLQFH